MIFGEEGERLLQHRAEDARRIQEDLLRQIAEKNRKQESPSVQPSNLHTRGPNYPQYTPYVPVEQQSYNPTRHQSLIRNTTADYNSSLSNSPPQRVGAVSNLSDNQATNGRGSGFNYQDDATSPNRAFGNGSNISDLHGNDGSVGYSSPVRDLAPQPLNPVSPGRARSTLARYAEPLPDLPPAGPSPDAIRFADRLVWLESSVDQNQGHLKSAYDTATRLERTAIPSLNDGVQQLRSALDRVMSVDIPGKMRPLEEENSRLEERINAATNDFQAQLQALRDRLGETGNVFVQTQNKFGEFSENVKSTLLEFKSEIGRARDSHDALSQRISASESRSAQIEEALRAASTTLSNFEKTAGETIGAAQSQMNAAISAASLQLATDIKQESDARDQATGVIHSQTEEVNQRVGASVANVQGVINDLSSSFKQSLTALSNSVRDALEETRAQSDMRYQEFSDRLDSLLAETDNNFNTVQNEAISTLAAINDHAVKSRDSLTSALAQECETRRKNETQIAKKYENFMGLIMNEMQLQTAQMEEMCNNATAKVITSCNEKLIPMKTEVQAIKERTKGIDNIVQQANNAERLISSLNTQLMENVGALGRQSSTIVGTIQKIRAESEEVLDNLGERLKIVEEQETTPQYASRTDVQEAFGRLSNEFDGRIQDIEQQIGVIFSSLSDLTMTMPAPKQKREPASEVLDRLANSPESK